MGNYDKASRLIICIDNYDSLLQQGLEAIRQRLNILVMEPYSTSLIFILMKWCFVFECCYVGKWFLWAYHFYVI